MPGTLPLEDAEQFFSDRLQQHASDAWQGLQQTVQQIQPPQVQLPQIDLNDVTQRLQQHAQDTWSAVQQQADQARQQAQAVADQAQAAQQQAADELERQRQAELERQRQQQEQAANQSALDLNKLDAAVQAARGAGESTLDRAVQAGTTVNDFIQKQQAVARETRAMAGLPPDPLLEPMELGKLGRQTGTDPYQQIVEQGVPAIVRGVQQGDAGAIIGGAVQTLLGAASALPGTGGAARAEQAASVGAEGLQRFLDGTPLGELTTPVPPPSGGFRAPGMDAGSASLRAALSDFLTGEGSEAGSIPARLGLRIGTGVAGGVAAAATTDPNAGPVERGGRILGATIAGAAAPSLLARPSNPVIDQAVLDSLRQAGLQGTGTAAARNAVSTVVDVTKQGMLSNPVGRVTDVIGNTIELLRSPVALTLGGRPREAAAGTAAVMQAVPDAGRAALAALKGTTQATLATESQTTRLWEPLYRIMGATDAFTRTLGEYQGMAERGSRLLSEAGMSPHDPGAAMFLATHAADLVAEGAQRGGTSVFSTLRTAAGGLPALDNLFNKFGRYKEGLLSSSDTKSQLLGALLDTQIPFAGVPSRILQIGVGRLPPLTQLQGGYRAIQALKAGDRAAFQRAVGETAMESLIQAQIAQGIREGNITGPDDPDHPSSVRVLGNWLNLSEWGGAYTLPMQIMAGFAQGYDAAGHKLYDTPSDEQLARVGEGLSASMKPLVRAVPGENMLHFLAGLGSGAGLDGALKQEISDVVTRVFAPGAAKFVEDLRDPVQRDISKSLPQSLYEPAQARIPGLAEMLPARIDPTTGEPMEKLRAGPGILVGAQSREPSALQVEANRLHKLGYDTTPPTQYPDKVTIAGSEVRLKPAEQRAVAEILGKRLATLGARIDAPAYQNLPHTRAGEDRRAEVLKAVFNAVDLARTNAVVQVLGRAETVQRIRLGQKVAGRFVNEGAAPQQIDMQDVARRTDPNAELQPLYLAESLRRRLLEEAQRRADEESQLLRSSSATGELVNG